MRGAAAGWAWGVSRAARPARKPESQARCSPEARPSTWSRAARSSAPKGAWSGRRKARLPRLICCLHRAAAGGCRIRSCRCRPSGRRGRPRPPWWGGCRWRSRSSGSRAPPADGPAGRRRPGRPRSGPASQLASGLSLTRPVTPSGSIVSSAVRRPPWKRLRPVIQAPKPSSSSASGWVLRMSQHRSGSVSNSRPCRS